ncbi:MAG: T9SS type A sorting domain-containing protein [Bacteroidetes bacterium]|nr:T9SS type A sorting domain-containing protein [Bacteroidota bacterium]
MGAAWAFRVTPSNNANLNALLLSSGTLSPAFASSTSTYTASTSATSITVTPTIADTNATIQVRVNSGSYALVNSGNASAALPLNLGINTIDVNVIAQDFSTTKTYTITVTRVPLVNTWTGTTSNVWNLATNWDPAQIPTNTDNVFIAASGNNPVLSATGAVKNITIDSGATLTVSGTLEITGNLSTLGTIDAANGNIILNGTAAQTLDAKGGTVQNLTINNAAGVALTGALNLTGILTPTAGVLTTGGNLTLKSSALTTASIASNLSGSNYISGNVTVERFIPGGRRAFRFFSHPFSNAVALSNMIGTTGLVITGQGGATNGFDESTLNNPSAFTFNEATFDGTNNSGWSAFTSTSNSIAVGAGMRALHRGSRSQLPAIVQASPPTPQSATIAWSGPITTGSKTFSMLKTAGANGGWNLIGNPYPSAVNIGTIASGNRNSIGTFSVWNPNAGTTGAYQTISFGADYILPSGSAFFINTPNAATFTFTEADKSTATPAVLFKNDELMQHAMEIKLWSDSSIHWDNFVLRNRSNLTDAYEYTADGLKMKNSNVNFYTVSSDNKNLAIDNRPLDESKEVKLAFETSSPYHFTFKVAHIQMPGLEVYLADKFANKEVLLTSNTAYDFVTTADAASQGAERFKLKFKNVPTTSVSELSTAKNAFSLYPNPASSTIHLSLANPVGTHTYAIYNQLGVQVKTGELNFDNQRSHAIQIETLASGIYFVKLDGGQVIRFVK